MERPKVNQLKAKHLFAGRPKIQGVVLHDTAGTGRHSDTLYLASPGDGRKVSVDFTVERDGSIWQLNPDLKKYYTGHAGRKTAFKGLRNGAVTRATVGIEICHARDAKLGPQDYPVEQVKAVAELCAWLTEEFKLTTSDITTHRQIITDGSRSDPRNFPFELFWQFYWKAKGRADEKAAADKMQKIPTAENHYKVLAGDSLWKIAQKVYGDGSKHLRIAKANNLKNGLIIPGMVLTIPK